MSAKAGARPRTYIGGGFEASILNLQYDRIYIDVRVILQKYILSNALCQVYTAIFEKVQHTQAKYLNLHFPIHSRLNIKNCVMNIV